jgi:alpha-tubulin suppressor-like RCC1 family protein
VAAVAAGQSHSLALQATQTLVAWGANGSGQLGDGTTLSRPTSVPVGGLTNAVALAAGFAHTCALLANGGARCWGSNGNGQLGDGTTTRRPTPAVVSGLANAIAMDAGGAHTCASLANGQARCWGENSGGQVGDGTTTQRLIPTTVTVQGGRPGIASVFVPLSRMVQITTGFRHSCAITADGAVWCWGENDSGQVGNGTTTDQLRPVRVPSFTLNIDPRVHLRSNGRVATVHVLATCEAGQRLHVMVNLTQGAVSGHGVGDEACTGGLEPYAVTVPAQGRNGFLAGPATVEADGLIRERGTVVDTQEWTRQVQISAR